VNFEEAIESLVKAMDEEKDYLMKQCWSRKGYEEFLEYLSLSLPYVHSYRYFRRTVKMFLYKGKYEKPMSVVKKSVAKGAKYLKEKFRVGEKDEEAEEEDGVFERA